MTVEEVRKKLEWFKKYNEEDYCGGDRIQDEKGNWYYLITDEDFEAFDVAIKALEQEPILDKLRAEIAEYGSIWVEYKITGRRDKDIEQLVSDVLSQAKKQVLEIIDKYKAESEK
jgi:hypothetical protein